MSKPKPDPRAEYIAGLRDLANALERHPELQLPYDGSGNSINVIPYGRDEQREQLAAWIRVLPGAKTKDTSHDGKAFYLEGRFHGLRLTVICDRSEVCERVVTGTREVVKTVPDPEALAAVPVVEVTETEPAPLPARLVHPAPITDPALGAGRHNEAGGWKGTEPGSCGVKCACDVTFDGFDTLAEATEQLNAHIGDAIGGSL